MNEGKCALYFEPGSAGELVKRIEEISSDKNLAEQLDATRHMRQTQIGDVSCSGDGIVESTKISFVAIEIRQFRPMRTGATRFDNAARRDIFQYPELCLHPRIIVETLANEITAKAVVNQNWQE